MAFGFDRERGATARGYVNVSNPDLPIGTRLSRRQYDKYVETIGKREHLPGLHAAAIAIRDAERHLDATRRALAARGAELDARERDILRREAELAKAERDARASVFNRVRSTSAGQRRFNTAIDQFVEKRRSEGQRITRRSASKDPEFKRLLAELKGRPNPKGDPVIGAANKARRQAAVDVLGGWREFEEQYRRRYPLRVRRSGNAGQSIRRRNRG